MPTLVLATQASATVMGAQVYERAIDQRAEAALAASGESWRVQRAVLRSMRSQLPGTRRVPSGWLHSASANARARAARLIYPRGDLVHRMKVAMPPVRGRDILTLHDVGPWKFDDEARPVPAAREELRAARAIVTPSAFSASEIVDLFGVEEPVVIPNGFDRARFADAQPLSPEQLEGLGVKGEFVLAAGGASKRKNLEGLAAAWPLVRRARPTLTLVLAGPEHPRRTGLFGALDGVALVGRVDDAVVPGLMAAAQALVVPSLYEGFGLPALEGMAVGVPVVATNASSLPEVLGDAGILVGRSSEELAEGIVYATSGEPSLTTLVDRGRGRSEEFSWERSAEAHARLWTTLV